MVQAVTKYNLTHGVERFFIIQYLSKVFTATPGGRGQSNQT